MQKIIILDFTNSKVHIFDYDLNIWEDVLEFLTSNEIDLNPNQCQWMIVDNLNIEIH